MTSLRRVGRAFAGFAFAGVAFVAPAHEEWNNLHIVYSAKSEFVYPFDGRAPKIAVALLNHHPTFAPETRFTLRVNGQLAGADAFPAFPNGGSIVVAPDDFVLASAITTGVYDGTLGAPPALGATKEVLFQFDFSLAPGAAPVPPSVVPGNPDPGENGDSSGTTTARVKFTNLGDAPALTGPFGVSGTVRFASGNATPSAVRAEIATPYSDWFPLALTPAGATSARFSSPLPARADWHVRLSAPGCESRVIPLGHYNDPQVPLDVTLTPLPAIDLDYRRVAAVTTPTGFWRGAVSESEGTFVAFPGQQVWKNGATDAENRALRAASRIFKYRFDGTKLWEHAPGWETWAGDMSADGRFVAYALNPTTQPFYTPAESKLVLLDGTTGAVLWTKSAPSADAAIGRKIESLELAFSPDARWLAVGSVTSGQVTLVDRATGDFVWSTSAAAPTFGQVRKLRFSGDGRFLFCGSGDSFLRKLRVSDGAVLWRTFVGGWPYVSGLDLTPDDAWLAAGTRSLDAAIVRASDGRIEWQRETQAVDAVFAPDGRHFLTAAGQVYRTLDGALAGMTKSSGLARFTPDSRFVLQLDRGLRLYDLGGQLVRTIDADVPAGLATAQWVHLSRDGRTVILLARDMTNAPQAGIAIYERRLERATTAPPTLAAQPLSQTVVAGGTLALAVEAAGAGPFAFQWQKNGADLAGKTSATLALANVSTGDAGRYACVVSNAAGSVTSIAATAGVALPDTADPGRLANLAVRTEVTGGAPLIVGFALGGEGTGGTKPLLIRGAGPSLAPLGVAGALADPRIALFSGANVVLENDNWAGSADISTLAARLGAFAFSSAASRDAALAAAAVRGSYTVQLASADGTSGTALAEIYDGTATFGAGTPRLVNLSARSRVSAGNGVLIAGFVVAGPVARTVLIRGIGPALGLFGLREALPDMQLALFRDDVRVAGNENWHDAPNAVALADAAARAGAFALPPSSADAALLISLPPGSYTVQVRAGAAAANAAGEALVEVYEVP